MNFNVNYPLVIKMMIGNLKINGFAALAPMAGVADRAMREICRENGAAYTVGELASAKGISLGDKKSEAFLSANDSERPYGSQLFGCDPSVMAEAARIAESYGPDFIDINMGCPAPKVAVSSGGGSALLKDPELAARVVDAVANAVSIPVTVKLRAGWDDSSKNAAEIAMLAERYGAKAITVHGRTRVQMYAPPVDLDIIKRVKLAVKVPVIGNGDVDSPKAAKNMLLTTGCDFLMVGRAAMGDPWIFARINAYLKEGTVLPEPSLSKRLETLTDQVERMVEYKGEKKAMLEARKHAAWYMRGLKGAAELRKLCGMISSKGDLDEVIKKALQLNP